MSQKSTASRVDARHELILIAADVAHRRYLPDLWNCRTIHDARLVIADYDRIHMDLMNHLKRVIDQL